ncbi:MAG TPA: nucleoside triphosphate pyrophosphohydrolase family protein [Candidatus Saccharimonadales bacterium]
MTFEEYQTRALDTVVKNNDPLMGKTIWAMGIVGEAGEVIEKWKKIVAYKEGKISDADLDELAKEIGDVLWYCAVFADSLGINLEDIVQNNLQKLQDRKKRSVIKGKGDNR